MKLIIIFSALFFTFLCNAQTKVISHKSHSGSVNSFSKAYRNNLFDIRYSNFGIPEHHIRRMDTIIALNNTTTVLKYRVSKTIHNLGTNFEAINESDIIRRSDTLKNDRLLNKNNTIKYIKSRSSIFYDTPIDKVVFIGFKKE